MLRLRGLRQHQRLQLTRRTKSGQDCCPGHSWSLRGECRCATIERRVRVEPPDKGIPLQPKPRRRARPPAIDITPDTLIWCPACQEEHPASEFNTERRRFSGLFGICREAQRRQRRTPEGRAATKRRNERRWANADYRARSLELNRERRKRIGANVDLQRARARLQAIVDEWKSEGCIDCGYGDIRAIDPDHQDSAQKDGNVSRLVQLCASAARIRAELAKCEPRRGTGRATTGCRRQGTRRTSTSTTSSPGSAAAHPAPRR